MPLVGETLLEVQPRTVNWFRLAIQQQQLAHAYVLQSNALHQPYQLALDVAKALNCEQEAASEDTATATTFCNTCRSCNWLNSNAHPNFITLSRLTYETDEDGKRAKPRTQISTDQIQQLLQQLALNSPSYRVVVFTDAEPAAVSTSAEPATWQEPYSWRSNNPNSRLKLAPLTASLFNAKSANQFLKTLEEPPPRVLFFFLTNSAEALLPTIVSRCQVVRFQQVACPPQEAFPSSVAIGLQQWFSATLAGQPVLQGSQQLEQLTASIEGGSLAQVLQWLQVWLRGFQQQQLAQQPQASPHFSLQTYQALQTTVQNALRSVQANVSPAAVLLQTQAKLQQLLKA